MRQLFPVFVIFGLASTLTTVVGHQCYNGCNGHGYCINSQSSCNCFNGWQGPDCRERVCPTGYAWGGEPTGTDAIRSAEVECSNAGYCDRTTGVCTCDIAYTGFACERLKCPSLCSGHGICTSLKTAATTKNGRNLVLSPTTYTLWDAERSYGCVCDHGYFGYDCSLKECPAGIDPKLKGAAVNEIQTIRCHDGSNNAHTAGTFSLTFRGHTTVSLTAAASLSTADVKAALEALPTITSVTVTFRTASASASVWCSAANYARITFTRENGDVPDIVGTGSSGGPTLTLQNVGADANTQSVLGVGHSGACNDRGLCDHAKGICTCNGIFSSSSGLITVATGNSGDCGFHTTQPTACAGSTSCSGHGTCSGSSNFICTCFEGFTGYDCSVQTCPKGKAWWDEPTATDTAHGMVECSGRGICAGGKCTCQTGYEGVACERISCPIDAELGMCSGAGRCLTTAERGLERKVNGVASPLTYGSDPAATATWDAHKIMSCKCDGDRNNKHELNERGGHSCKDYFCRTGDNPVTTANQNNEVQIVKCTATQGTFSLSFRGQTTVALPFGATVSGFTQKFSGVTVTVTVGANTFTTSSDQSSHLAANDVVILKSATSPYESREYTVASVSTTTVTTTSYIGMPSASTYTMEKKIVTVESALEDLTTIRNVTVTAFAASDGTTAATIACAATAGNNMHITFTEDFGDLPALVPAAVSSGPTFTVTESVVGTKENKECSDRGVCDRTTGLCACFQYASSGDGHGNSGTRADCSFETKYQPFEA